MPVPNGTTSQPLPSPPAVAEETAPPEPIPFRPCMSWGAISDLCLTE